LNLLDEITDKNRQKKASYAVDKNYADDFHNSGRGEERIHFSPLIIGN
jgi:hypothetical protein